MESPISTFDVEDILTKLTLEEKVALLSGLSFLMEYRPIS